MRGNGTSLKLWTAEHIYDGKIEVHCSRLDAIFGEKRQIEETRS
jgi:hypothetical protein